MIVVLGDLARKMNECKNSTVAAEKIIIRLKANNATFFVIPDILGHFVIFFLS